jgi:hypothetical protein
MDVAVEFQVSPESVRHDRDDRFGRIFHANPLLNHSSGENWEIVKKVAVPFENGPEFAWHSKDHA